MERTIFERIIACEIPATIEYEDADIIAIRDIAPAAPVHVLIIPKRVITSVDALAESDTDLVGRVFLVARDLARKYGIAENGYRVVTNCNADGGQTVFHLHFHLLGGEPLGRMNSASMSHVPAVASTALVRSTTLRDIVIVLAVTIGLAIGFNAMNPKAIAWIKPEFERQTATQTDIDKYLAPSTPAPSQPKEVIQQTPAQEQSATPLTTNAKPTAGASALPSPQPLADASTKVAPEQTFTSEPGVVREITYDMFVRLYQGSKNYLIDARGADKFAQGHINGAVNYYGGEVQSRIPDLLANVPRDRVILIYCDGGECELSHHVADVLKQFGYGPVFIYTGGWAEWTSKRK